MKKTGFVYSVGAVCILVLAGCISVPNTPAPRFYSLEPIGANQAAPKFNIAPNIIIAVGPVRIPEYLNRPQIVTQNEDKMLTFAQFDRWGEPLELALMRLISADLAVMLPAASIEVYPWSLAIPVKYQVLVDVAQLDSQLDGDLFLTVQWSIVDTLSNKMILTRRSEFRNPVNPHNYSGLAKTLSTASASLTLEIAKAVTSLATPP